MRCLDGESGLEGVSSEVEVKVDSMQCAGG